MDFHNDLISFALPHGWESSEDDDGNILCYDPYDLTIWLQVELMGVEKPGEQLSARSFLAECYTEEIKDGTARSEEIDPQTTLVTRMIAVEHEGIPYAISYFHVAHNPDEDDIQLAQFGFAFPENLARTERTVALEKFFGNVARTAVFYPWASDGSL